MKLLAIHVLHAGGAKVPYVWVARRSGLQRALENIRSGDQSFASGLAATVLDPFLAHWAERGGDRRHLLAAVTDAAMSQCLAVFASIRRPDLELPNESLLAALALTANLQRTLVMLAEHLARPASDDAAPARPLRLCREWCGLLPSQVNSGSVADRAVAKALGCAPVDVNRQCDEALSNLRGDLRRGKLLAREDWESYANRSGVVRAKNSSM